MFSVYVLLIIVCSFVLLFWSLYCLSFDLWLLTTPLVSPNFSSMWLTIVVEEAFHLSWKDREIKIKYKKIFIYFNFHEGLSIYLNCKIKCIQSRYIY